MELNHCEEDEQEQMLTCHCSHVFVVNDNQLPISIIIIIDTF